MPAAAQATGVLAGSLIENTAQASYELGGEVDTITSNTVIIRVDEDLDVTVSALAGPAPAAPGASAVAIPFEVTNIGNGPEAFRLFVNPSAPGSDLAVTPAGFAIESNGNSLYEPGIDLLLPASAETGLLAPDGSVRVYVLVDVPAGAAAGERAIVDLRAEAVTGAGATGTIHPGAGAAGADAVVGLTGADDDASSELLVAGPRVRLAKSAVVSGPQGGISAVPGARITYTILATVEGAAAIENLRITDPIPAGTTYRAGTLRLDAQPLTDAAGDDAGEASAAGVAVNLGAASAGSSHSISFEVEID